MKTRRIFCILLAGLAPFLGAGAKKPKVILSVTGEVPQSNGETFTLPVTFANAKRRGFVGRIPVINARDVDFIFPFESPDGTMGCAFYLDYHGKGLLDAYTVQNRGKSMIFSMNGRQVTDLVVDKRIPDGIFVVPAGLTAEEIAKLRSSFKLKAATTSENPTGTEPAPKLEATDRFATPTPPAPYRPPSGSFTPQAPTFPSQPNSSLDPLPAP